MAISRPPRSSSPDTAGGKHEKTCVTKKTNRRSAEAPAQFFFWPGSNHRSRADVGMDQRRGAQHEIFGINGGVTRGREPCGPHNVSLVMAPSWGSPPWLFCREPGPGQQAGETQGWLGSHDGTLSGQHRRWGCLWTKRLEEQRRKKILLRHRWTRFGSVRGASRGAGPKDAVARAEKSPRLDRLQP